MTRALPAWSSRTAWFSDARQLQHLSYNANFTSTSGRLSAQFGIHYVNFKEADADARAHGVAGSGVAVLEFPVAGRFEDGVPKAAFALHLGSVPTAFISGERNFLTVPFCSAWLAISRHARHLSSCRSGSAPRDPSCGPNASRSTHSYVRSTPNGKASPRNVPGRARSEGRAIESGSRCRASRLTDLPPGQNRRHHLYACLEARWRLSATTSTVGASLLFRWTTSSGGAAAAGRDRARELAKPRGRFRACPNARFWLTPEHRGQTTTPTPSRAQPASHARASARAFPARPCSGNRARAGQRATPGSACAPAPAAGGVFQRRSHRRLIGRAPASCLPSRYRRLTEERA